MPAVLHCSALAKTRLTVIDNVKARLSDMKTSLPETLKSSRSMTRSNLIHAAVETLKGT